MSVLDKEKPRLSGVFQEVMGRRAAVDRGLVVSADRTTNLAGIEVPGDATSISRMHVGIRRTRADRSDNLTKVSGSGDALLRLGDDVGRGQGAGDGGWRARARLRPWDTGRWRQVCAEEQNDSPCDRGPTEVDMGLGDRPLEPLITELVADHRPGRVDAGREPSTRASGYCLRSLVETRKPRTEGVAIIPVIVGQRHRGRPQYDEQGE